MGQLPHTDKKIPPFDFVAPPTSSLFTCPRLK